MKKFKNKYKHFKPENFILSLLLKDSEKISNSFAKMYILIKIKLVYIYFINRLFIKMKLKVKSPQYQSN